MKTWERILGQIFPFLGALFLGVELFWRFNKGKSLCSTESCSLVGNYIRFEDTYLIALGFVFLLVLFLFHFLYFRSPDKTYLKKIIYGLFCAGFIVDGVLLGFQIFIIKTFCQICFIFAGILLISWFSFTFSQQKYLSFLLGCSLYGLVIGSFALLSLPANKQDALKPLKLEELNLISWAKEDAPLFPRAYLFMSFHCEHCSKVLANLAVNPKVAEISWHIFPLDSKEADFKRLSYVLNSEGTKGNPFLEILKVESGEVDVSKEKVAPNLASEVKKVQQYFLAQGFTGVPTLILEENPGKKVIFTGSRTIIDYLKDKGYVQRVLNFSAGEPR